MHKITKVETKADYTLILTFDNGVEGEISIKDRLFGSMFEPLKDHKYFDKAAVDKFGAVCWPNDADLAPDVLYRRIKSQ